MGVFEDLQEGKIGFAEFERKTRKRWQAMARQVMQRWRPPPSIDEHDIVQEMLLAVHQLVSGKKFDAGRGGSAERYLVWNAYSEGKRHAHRHRHALRLSDTTASRHAILTLGCSLDSLLQDHHSASGEPPKRSGGSHSYNPLNCRDKLVQQETQTACLPACDLSWPQGLAVKVLVNEGSVARAVGYLAKSPVMRRLGLDKRGCESLLRGAIEQMTEAA